MVQNIGFDSNATHTTERDGFMEKVKARSVIKEMIVARFTIWRRSSSSIPLVIVKNTGMVPNGLVNVKKEVKHSNANGNNVSIDVLFLGYGQK